MVHKSTIFTNSGGGGSPLTITDGTHTINNTTQITVTGATVGGTSPNATLTVTGGISGPGTTVAGDIVTWNNTTGTLVADSGFNINTLPAATAYQETPSGSVNGTNTTFTLAHAPAGLQGVIVILDGVTQYYGVDYTVSGSTITFITAPANGSTIWAIYNTLTSGVTYTPQTIAFSTTITPNFALGVNVNPIICTNNFTLANPTGLLAGMSGAIPFNQDITGSRIITLGTAWRGPGLLVQSLSVQANARDLLVWYCPAGSDIVYNILQNY